jgi:multisubunit Na+/H+ antiporter MnhB subunit
MDSYTLGIIVAVVVVTTIVLYIYDRRTKQQPVEVVDAAKLAVGAGAIAGGVTYAVGGDALPDVMEAVTKTAESAQEMFVGKPEF